MMSSNTRFVLLDGARGIAALAVVLFHLYSGTNRLFGHFFLFVDFFFVLSGFVLAHVIIKIETYESVTKFLINRFIRLAPMAYSAVSVVILMQIVVNLKYLFSGDQIPKGIPLDVLTLFFTFLFLQVFSLNSQLLLYPLWSLSAEWLSNILASVTKKVSKRREIIFFITPGLFLLVVATFILENSFWQNTWNQLGRGLFGFGLGLGLWRVRNRFKLRARASLHLVFGVILSGLVLVLNHFSKELALFVSSPLFATSILMFYRFEMQVTKIWLSGSLKYLGRLSYGIYIWHVVATNILSVLSKNLEIEYLEIGYSLGIPRLLAVLILTTLFTELTIRFIESPLRGKFTRV